MSGNNGVFTSSSSQAFTSHEDVIPSNINDCVNSTLSLLLITTMSNVHNTHDLLLYLLNPSSFHPPSSVNANIPIINPSNIDNHTNVLVHNVNLVDGETNNRKDDSFVMKPDYVLSGNGPQW